MSENNPDFVPPEEQLEAVRPLDQLASLREYRIDQKHTEALQYVDYILENTKIDMGKELLSRTDLESAAESGTIKMQSNANSAYGRSVLNAVGLAAGHAPDAFTKEVKHLQKDNETSLDLGKGIHFLAKQYNPLVGLNLEIDKQVPLSERTQHLGQLVERVKATESAYDNALESVKQQLGEGSHEAYATEAFSFEKDADRLIRFIGNSRDTANEEFYTGGPAKTRQMIIESIYKLPSHYEGLEPKGEDKKGLYFDASGKLQKVLLTTSKPGVFLAVKNANPEDARDITELYLQFGIELDAVDMYAEADYNYHRYENVEPFIETEAAGQLLTAFDTASLTLSGRLRDSFAEVGKIETRYGHGYSEITRELAKLANDKDRSLDTFFNNGSNGNIQNLISTIDLPADPAAEAVVSILKDVVDRKQQVAGVKNLPISSNRIEIRDGACKDAEVYIATGGPVEETEGEPRLWRSSYKRDTVVALEPVLFNGVLLPKGSLFAVEDDGYVFMRLTSFTFSREEAAQAFGPQEAENQASGFNMESARRYILGAGGEEY